MYVTSRPDQRPLEHKATICADFTGNDVHPIVNEGSAEQNACVGLSEFWLLSSPIFAQRSKGEGYER